MKKVKRAKALVSKTTRASNAIKEIFELLDIDTFKFRTNDGTKTTITMKVRIDRSLKLDRITDEILEKYGYDKRTRTLFVCQDDANRTISEL